jgi:hypothetical protein
MLSRFIISAGRLGELAELSKSEKIRIKNEISFSVLGKGDVVSAKFLNDLKEDVQKISAFRKKLGNKIKIEAFEVPLPLELLVLPDISKLVSFFETVSGLFEGALSSKVKIFYETKPDKNLPALSQAIAVYNLNGGRAGYKLRTGGVEASAFPHPDQIAYVIKTCRDAGVPMKCTAGLHHPYRHYDKSIKTGMQGFINVFGSGILSYTLDISQPLIFEVLTDENSSNFKFDDDGFGWKNFKIFNEEIEEAREKFMISFGSCSFDEPIEDLKTLKLL